MSNNEVYMLARPLSPDETNEIIDRKGGMRLNASMKGNIVTKAMKHAFEKREAALLKEEQTITKAFWLKLFGYAKLKAALVLGEPFVRTNSNTHGEKMPDGVAIAWRVGGQHVSMRCQMPMPNYVGHVDHKHFTIKDEKLVERARKWQEDTEELRKEYNKVSATLTAMLANIGTFKSLQNNWPEGKPFYKHLPKEFPFRHQVPATLVADLNKSLGV